LATGSWKTLAVRLTLWDATKPANGRKERHKAKVENRQILRLKGSIVFGQDNAIGWVDTVAFDKTHDAQASQGWCPAVLDTNGDGTITEWTEPKEPIDPKKDHRIEFGCYGDARRASSSRRRG
jgi:hypothetical protein